MLDEAFAQARELVEAHRAIILECADAPCRLVRGLTRHSLPMVLLVRLAIAVSEQGQGLGTGLLFEALHRAALAAEHAAARLIVVDPSDDRAGAFSQRWGFWPVEGDANGRLFVRTRDALASFSVDYERP